MYSLIQLFAVARFFISFLIPFLWIWGHGFSIVLFVVASLAARSAKRQKKILKELQKQNSA